jgi:hypothetical protein
MDWGFDFWNKPSSSFLASRIPYGEEITLEKLQMVENAENIIHDLDLFNLRVCWMVKLHESSWYLKNSRKQQAFDIESWGYCKAAAFLILYSTLKGTEAAVWMKCYKYAWNFVNMHEILWICTKCCECVWI